MRAIAYTGDLLAIVNTYNRSGRSQSADYWDHPDAALVRAAIKDHYEREQEFRCCYCQQQLLSGHGRVWDAEHIVPRSIVPRFLFEPRNLAVACVDCNSTKSDTSVVTRNRRPRAYPSSSSDFTIIHPHFDHFDAHIAIYLGKIYSAKSAKGQKTIELCGLMRYAYAFGGWDAGMGDPQAVLRLASELSTIADPAAQRVKLMELVLIAQVQLSRALLE